YKAEHRPTPTPGPNDLLIEVKAIALNPIDRYQRDLGFPALAGYPAIVGSDIAGIVLSAGSSVPADAPKPGTRVCAFAAAFFYQGAPDYGALQERVLVPAVNAVPLPDGMSFKEASILPMSVVTNWSGLYSIGIPRDTAYIPADKQGMLVWGGASSVGSGALQVAKLLGFSVYVTASEKHHSYLKSLGATRVFDYHSDDVVASIVKAAKEDGVAIKTGYVAVGSLQQCLDVLKEFKGDGMAKLASAPRLSPEAPKVDGIEVKFVMGPLGEEARTEHFHFIFHDWLKEKLDTGKFVPSPQIKVVEEGLLSANKALDEMKQGISGTKVVLEV
ncbi:chaperonin 10-like protein, partial [Lipomyces tetrasporus]